MPTPTSYRIPESACPSCGARLDAASGLDHDNAPKPGNVWICIQCAEIVIYDEQLGLRKPTLAEMIELQTSQEWPLIAAAVRTARAMHAKPKGGAQ